MKSSYKEGLQGYHALVLRLSYKATTSYSRCRGYLTRRTYKDNVSNMC